MKNCAKKMSKLWEKKLSDKNDPKPELSVGIDGRRTSDWGSRRPDRHQHFAVHPNDRWKVVHNTSTDSACCVLKMRRALLS